MRRFVDTVCESCARVEVDQYLDWNEPYPLCTCGGQTTRQLTSRTVATVIGDDIPGGVLIKHGLCHEDGTPRRFDSKTEIRREAKRRGLAWGHDENKHVPLRGSDRGLETRKW